MFGGCLENVWRASDANLIQILRKSHANLMQFSCKSHTNLMHISCKSYANLRQILDESDANIVQISCKSQANLIHEPCPLHPHSNVCTPSRTSCPSSSVLSMSNASLLLGMKLWGVGTPRLSCKTQTNFKMNED